MRQRLRNLGRVIGERFDLRRTGDIQSAFTAVLTQRLQSLFVYPLPVESGDIRHIAGFALTTRLPTATFWEGYTERGFLIFYGSRTADWLVPTR